LKEKDIELNEYKRSLDEVKMKKLKIEKYDEKIRENENKLKMIE
jgi:hypothetical protein